MTILTLTQLTHNQSFLFQNHSVHFSDTYKTKHIISQRARPKWKKRFHSGLNKHKERLERASKHSCFCLDRGRFNQKNFNDKLTGQEGNKSHKQLSVSNAHYTVSSCLLMTWQRLRSLRGQCLPGVSVSGPPLLLCDVSNLFASFCSGGDSSSRRFFCGIAQFHWREIQNQLWPSCRALKQAGRHHVDWDTASSSTWTAAWIQKLSWR